MVLGQAAHGRLPRLEHPGAPRFSRSGSVGRDRPVLGLDRRAARARGGAAPPVAVGEIRRDAVDPRPRRPVRREARRGAQHAQEGLLQQVLGGLARAGGAVQEPAQAAAPSGGRRDGRQARRRPRSRGSIPRRLGRPMGPFSLPPGGHTSLLIVFNAGAGEWFNPEALALNESRAAGVRGDGGPEPNGRNRNVHAAIESPDSVLLRARRDRSRPAARLGRGRGRRAPARDPLLAPSGPGRRALPRAGEAVGRFVEAHPGDARAWVECGDALRYTGEGRSGARRTPRRSPSTRPTPSRSRPTPSEIIYASKPGTWRSRAPACGAPWSATRTIRSPTTCSG